MTKFVSKLGCYNDNHMNIEVIYSDTFKADDIFYCDNFYRSEPMKKQETLDLTVIKDLIATLEKRFASNMNRHKELSWNNVLLKLEKHPSKL